MSSGRLLLGATPLGQPSDASPRWRVSHRRCGGGRTPGRCGEWPKADIRIGGRIGQPVRPGGGVARDGLLDAINNGATVLVVEETPGTPVISDPGYRLIAACIDAKGVSVTCLPGRPR